jgi:hypothetical protein
MKVACLLLNICVLILISTVTCDNLEHHNEFTREWAVKVSDPLLADLIALETGFANHGLVSF